MLPQAVVVTPGSFVNIESQLLHLLVRYPSIPSEQLVSRSFIFIVQEVCMRRLLALALLLGFVLCSHTPASAAGVAHEQGVKQPAGPPEITILSPKNEATVADTTITVQLVLLNFKPVPSKVPPSEFGQHPEANHPNEGHIHLLLDVGPVVTIDQGMSYTFMNVPPGHHTLKAYLANNDHSDLIPSVVHQIEFTTVTSAPLLRGAAKPLMFRLPKTAELDGLLTSELAIMLLLVISMAVLIGGLTTQSYGRVAIFNAEINAHIHSIQRIASARRRANTEKQMEPTATPVDEAAMTEPQ
jgi:hypothetical protein